jgi:hypothetical protein
LISLRSSPFVRTATISLLVSAFVFAAHPQPGFAATYRVVVNGNALTMPEPPVERGGRVFVPLRSIFESLGAGVAYDNGTINATLGDKTVQVKIGSSQAIVNGQQQFLDAPPYIVGATTMVPLRFVSEALGATVDYDSTNGTISIAAAKVPIPNGSTINATINKDVNTRSAYVGQPILLNVQPPYPGGDVLLTGAVLSGKVVDVQAGAQGTNPRLEIVIDSIRLSGTSVDQPISANIVKIEANRGSNVAKEAGGTLAGMLLGNWIGKTVGTNQGGAAGAIAGYLLTSNSKTNIDVPAGSLVVLQLTNTLALK